MKKLLCLLCFLVLLTAFSAPVMAESDCWYAYKYGTHDYEQVDVRKATCSEDGYYLLECRQCGKNDKKITGKATGHKWQKISSESFSPTCTKKGVTTYVCDNCTQQRTESVKALGHDWEDKKIQQSATCAEEGVMSVRCRRCEKAGTRTIDKTEHSYGEWVVTIPETDHSAGERSSVCSACSTDRTEVFYPEGTLLRGMDGQSVDAVREMQQMLMDLHILDDKADGVFGKKTEAAVLAYQKQADLGADGIAWPQTLNRLMLDWQEATGIGTAESSPVLTNSDTSAPRTACAIASDENGAEGVQYCSYHQELAEMSASLLTSAGETGALRAHKQLRTLWQAELEGLYGEWIQSVPAEEQGAIIAAQATFMSYLAVQETALQRQYGDETAIQQINAALERQCITLCNILYGEQ